MINFTSIFSGVPKGVNIRRLDTKRKAQHQRKAFKFSGSMTGRSGVVYGDSVKEVLNKLNKEPEVQYTTN